ncbi:putative cnl2 nkp2 family protein [Golovinomyces cichoracearum]|uniref:Putative cnl2 nkp2 family protein n=1 Tax=Golovinomyces cichoracearum TaxID=62708 RepID=A0A420IN14_9PEZI|nr:putative cnl2 nkp2 family protein [Golovinomyces cichoracearum]
MSLKPTEYNLLAEFLLAPAPLHAIISLKTFTTLFPHSQRSLPTIKALYRDLQLQRLQKIERISQNISDEARRGSQQRRAIARARRADNKLSMADEDIEIEEYANGPSCNLPTCRPHTLESIIPELVGAINGLSYEIQEAEEEETSIMEEMQKIVGGLSDLRYGTLENSDLKDQVIERCSRLDYVCNGN